MAGFFLASQRDGNTWPFQQETAIDQSRWLWSIEKSDKLIFLSFFFLLLAFCSLLIFHLLGLVSFLLS